METKESAVSIRILSEQGPNLPIGASLNGQGPLVKTMATRPWRMKEERELGALRDKSKNTNLARHVSLVLAVMYEQLGPWDFSKMKMPERQRHVGELLMGDVYYAYIWLRRATMGHQLDFDVRCPLCGHIEPFYADLDTVEVRSVNSIKEACWKYPLRNPFDIRGKSVSWFTIGPPRWHALESLPPQQGFNTGEAKVSLIQSSIYAMDGDGPVLVSPDELGEMTKLDIEELASEIDRHHIGPDMSIEKTCGHCNQEFRQPIDWNYDNFFSTSSRSKRQID